MSMFYCNSWSEDWVAMPYEEFMETIGLWLPAEFIAKELFIEHGRTYCMFTSFRKEEKIDVTELFKEGRCEYRSYIIKMINKKLVIVGNEEGGQDEFFTLL